MSFLNKLFGRRSRGLGNLFGARRRSSSIGQTLNNHRGGVALGTIATLAAPFIISKLRARRAMR